MARITAAGTVVWYLTDYQHSVIGMVDSTGSSLGSVTYDGFGNVLTNTTGVNGDRYGFTSREWDSAVNLQYNRARYYDPSLGKWTSMDPMGFDAGDANLYRYAGNEGTVYVDPSGLKIKFSWYGALGGAGGGAFGGSMISPGIGTILGAAGGFVMGGFFGEDIAGTFIVSRPPTHGEVAAINSIVAIPVGLVIAGIYEIAFGATTSVTGGSAGHMGGPVSVSPGTGTVFNIPPTGPVAPPVPPVPPPPP